MASVIPKEVKKEITDGWVAETHKVALLVGYTFVDGHDVYADVSGWEHANVGGYTTGGAVLAGKASTNVGTTAKFDATDSSWGPGASLTNVNFAVIYETTGGKIRDIVDLGGTFSCVDSTFSIIWSASGIVVIS